MHSRFLRTILLFAGISLFINTRAEVLRIYNAAQLEKPLNLVPYLAYFEDTKNNKSFEEVTSSVVIFSNSSVFRPQKWKSTYWAKMEIENCSGEDFSLSLSFNALTNVELFEIKNGIDITKHESGLFKSKKEISHGDDHNQFNLTINKGEKISYYLRINHSKGYLPKLQFYLQNNINYLSEKGKTDNYDYMIFGAFIIFFIYTLVHYFFTRYIPYLCLSVYTLAMALYGFNLSGQLISFFPNQPEFIWRFNSIFTAIAGISGLLLMSVFFNLKKINPILYSLIKISVIISFFQLIISQLIIEFIHNYRVMTQFNLIVSLLYLPLIIMIPILTWKKLARPQKFFATAIFIYAGFLSIGLFLIFVFEENSFHITSYLNNLSGIISIALFTIALGEQMRGIEMDRNLILFELNQLKNEQNRKLEDLVGIRTKELREVNLELINGKEELEKRNRRIELLLRELHHRVKNNLQLISSFYDLRRNDPYKKNLKEIADEGQNRVRVMAMVHDMLYHGDNTDTIEINAFIHQIVVYLDTIFNPGKIIETRIECDELTFDMDTAIPLGLILNELLTNSFKHAKTENNKLEISITMTPESKYVYSLVVTDNGNEIEDQIITYKSQSFGLHMIYLLSKQLNGNFRYNYDGKNNFIVKFMDSEGRRQIP